MTYNAIFDVQGLDRCILIICPMSHDQSGRKLAATLAAIQSNNLQCDIFLADDLDRHNTGSLDIARQRADHWLDIHKPILGTRKITRWHEVTQQPNFMIKYREIRRIYRDVPLARAQIDQICSEHTDVMIGRFLDKKIPIDRSKIMQASVDYMLEEIAGLSVIREMNPAPEIYPGLYFDNPEIFNQYSQGIDLTLPSVRSVRFELLSSKSQLAA